MSEPTLVQAEVPSTEKLLTATAIALAAAIVILVAFVLPAEYGIDPLGTGRALGLGDLARATVAAPTVPQAPAAVSGSATTSAVKTSINPVLVPSPAGDAPTVENVFIAQRDRFQMDSREIVLDPGEGMEIKYNMKKGAGLIYSWSATAALPFEFHGEPDLKPAGKAGTDYYESYELNDKAGSDHANGTFLAPSTGIHGWFWENKTSKPVTLRLVSAGFYDWISQNRKNKQTALKPMDPFALRGHPSIPDEPMR
jgi:hypothetical protein